MLMFSFMVVREERCSDGPPEVSNCTYLKEVRVYHDARSPELQEKYTSILHDYVNM